MTADSLAGFRQSTLLAGMPPALVDAIARAVEPVELGGGDVLFREGEPGDSLFFVLSGRLRVQRSQGANTAVIAEILAGESVGEMAALTGDKRSATVVAIRNCRLARLTRANLDRLLHTHPEFLSPIALLMARRLAQPYKTGQLRKAASCFTLLKASDGVDLDAVTAKLDAALSRVGKVTVVGADAMPPGAARGQPNAKSAFADWAHGLEAAHDFVLFVGSDTAAAWNEHCLRQADMVLICGDAGRAPDHGPGTLPAWLNASLILLQNGETRQTAAWLEAYPGAVHFNVRMSAAADFDRVARLVTGRGVGLVLGGGGARGMAHIGVVKALAEAGIAVDRIGGTSQGGLVGATYAIGLDHREMLEIFGRFRRDNPTNDLTVPTVSLIAGRKAERLLRAQFGERRIEDLPIDYFCISSSLTTGHVHVHRRGLLREALRASISIPGIFPPVARNGEFLVDGGVLDNLPIGPMRERGAIRVIAVNVTVAHGLTPRASEPKRGLFRLKPRAPGAGAPRYRLPSIVQTLMSAGSLGTVARLDALRRAADLFIEPPVDTFRTLDWDRIEEIVELGYRHACECLRTWAEK